jgi:hypothetical protein
MEIGEDEPPDKGGGQTTSSKKRPNEDHSDLNELGKRASPPSASIVHTYVRPGYENNSDIKYSESDGGPYVVHVSREDTDLAKATNRMRALRMAQVIYNGKVAGIKEIQSVGKNKMSVYFASASEANSFLVNPVLAEHKLNATIPRFQVSRMGVVTHIPLDWSLEEFATGIECPARSGPVIKARRLNKKREVDGKRVWEPTATVVLTFLGQTLPEKIYCFSMSIPVASYRLPIIQCHKCCRYGHIKDQCRSNARCSRCAQNHEVLECKVPDTEVSCLFCSGPHVATDFNCPEFSRQKGIKSVMSEENIGYIEAARRFRSVRTSYADKTRNNIENHQNAENKSSFSSPPASPSCPQFQSQTHSYRKTISIERRPKPVLGKSYDIDAHRNMTATPQSSLPNGCALGQPPSITPNDNLGDLISQMLINLLAKFADIIPYTVLQSLQGHISSAINRIIQDSQSQSNPMEY